MSRVTCCLIAVLLAAVVASSSTATQLIFEPASGSFGDFGALATGYGNRVTATIQDGFAYTLDGGATPNVVTSFGPTAGLVDLFTWSTSFGDLTHVLFAREPFQFEMRLIADAGYTVSLNSFDMAGWPQLDFPSIASVSVEDGLGNLLYSQSDVYIHGAIGGPQHTHFSLSGVTAPELRLKYDSRTDGHGVTLDSDDVGIDNINFSQSSTVDVPRGGSTTTGTLSLSAAPNPFRSSVTFAVQVPRPAALTLDVFDLRGTRIARLVDGTVGSGRHEYTWNGQDTAGRRLHPGLYWVQATVEGRRTTRSIVFVR